MIESAARRDRVDSSSLSPVFLWEVPEKPVSVRLAFDLIDRMEREVVEGFRSLTSRGSEIGGLLLGRVLPGDPVRLSVEDFETVECDYSRGPLYRLSDADLGRLERSIEQRAEAGGLLVVGFFRSHTRKGLTLDAEDLAFLEAHLREPHHIALLVRPFATKASIAGIFIREDGVIRAEASYLEFPFRTAQLTPARKESASPARGQIVLIAPRRETSVAPAVPVEEITPARVVEPEPPPVTAPAPMPEVAEAIAAPYEPPELVAIAPPTIEPAAIPPEVVEPVAVAPPAIAPAVVAPVAVAPAAIAPAVIVPTVVVPAVVEPVAVEFAEAEPVTKPSHRRLGLILGVVGAVVISLVIVLFLWGPWHSGTARIPETNAEASSVSLRAEHTGADLMLTWNRDAAAIQNAARAVLSVYDGGRQESYEMDLGQLRTGSIVYAPLTTDVSFKLDLTEKDQRTITATVRMLRTRPSPMPAESQPPADTAAKSSAEPAPAVDTEAATKANATDAVVARPNMAGAPVKPFDASSLAARLRPVRTADLPDAPNLGGGVPVTPKVSTETPSFAATPMAPAPAPPPAPAAAPPSAESKTGAKNTGGRIQQAELVLRHEPAYPPMARQMGIKGTVELEATVDTNGHVKAVKVLRGHPVLAKAATDAVMQWIYRPTLLNGVPVSAETRITLNFTGAR